MPTESEHDEAEAFKAMQADLLARPGSFFINRAILYSEPDLAQKIMAECVIVRCESLALRDSFQYHAFSLQFEKSPAHMVTPEYVWVIDREAGTVTAQRRQS